MFKINFYSETLNSITCLTCVEFYTRSLDLVRKFVNSDVIEDVIRTTLMNVIVQDVMWYMSCGICYASRGCVYQ